MSILCIFTQACHVFVWVFCFSFLLFLNSKKKEKKLSEQNVVAKFSTLRCCLAQPLGK